MSSTSDINVDDDDPSQGLAVAFRNDKVVARAIVKSDYLKDAVNELLDIKQAGATCCTVGESFHDCIKSFNISSTHNVIRYIIR